MKNRKWIWVTLATLLTLVVLAVVAGMAYRMGAQQTLAQAANGGAVQQFPFDHMRGGFDGNGMPGFQQNGGMPGFQQYGDPRMMQGFGRRGMDGRGFGPLGFLGPIFGLIKLAVLAALIWFGVKLVRNSGWRLTREAPQAPAAETEPVAPGQD